METLNDTPILFFASIDDWETWLSGHHEQPNGVWLKFAKKGTGITSMSYAEALDGALCYGWIDAQKKSFDETFWLQKFTPRRPRSVWSRINKDHIARLTAAGRMTPSGLREVEAARQDGRWDAAYQSQKDLTLPDDFLAELDRYPDAKTFFETLNKANRYAICYRVETAKKPATRRARIEKLIAMLEAKEKIHP